MIDRSELLLRSLKRVADDAANNAAFETENMKRPNNAAGRLQSGHTASEAERIYTTAFRDGCVAIMEKIQLEDRDHALEVAEIARTKVIQALLTRMAKAGAKEIATTHTPSIGSFAGGLGGGYVMAEHEAEMGLRLSMNTIASNVVEDFQLAVTRQSPRMREAVHIATYVDAVRIEALRAKTSVQWDFARLVALCEEMNTCWTYGAHHAVAMLTRSLLDHVPPIFGAKSFAEVASNYGGPKSFKDAMQYLEKGCRSIADGHLHLHIRSREALPTSNQVDFRSGVDLLLAEIIRIVP